MGIFLFWITGTLPACLCWIGRDGAKGGPNLSNSAGQELRNYATCSLMSWFYVAFAVVAYTNRKLNLKLEEIGRIAVGTTAAFFIAFAGFRQWVFLDCAWDNGYSLHTLFYAIYTSTWGYPVDTWAGIFTWGYVASFFMALSFAINREGWVTANPIEFLDIYFENKLLGEEGRKKQREKLAYWVLPLFMFGPITVLLAHLAYLLTAVVIVLSLPFKATKWFGDLLNRPEQQGDLFVDLKSEPSLPSGISGQMTADRWKEYWRVRNTWVDNERDEKPFSGLQANQRVQWESLFPKPKK